MGPLYRVQKGPSSASTPGASLAGGLVYSEGQVEFCRGKAPAIRPGRMVVFSDVITAHTYVAPAPCTSVCYLKNPMTQGL